MFFKIYRYINILSLDVVAGACISSLFIADILDVTVSPSVLGLLGLTVWLIYTFDHLQDARNISHTASTERHRYHQKNFNVLVWACVLALLAVSLLLFSIPARTLLWGASLGSLVGAYFLLLHLLKLKTVYHKEVMIAVIYSAGVLLPAVSIYSGPYDGRIVLLFLQFFALALTNLLSFALFEVSSDEQDRLPSLVRVFGEKSVLLFLRVLVIAQLSVAAFFVFQKNLAVLEVVILSMVLVFSSMLLLRQYVVRHELYRFIGDAAFMFPLIGILALK